MIQKGDLGELPNQTKLPSTPVRAQQRHEVISSQDASLELEAPVERLETDVHHVRDRSQKQPANSFQPHQQSHVIRSSPCFPASGAPVDSTTLK
jgi:hypothetical protein